MPQAENMTEGIASRMSCAPVKPFNELVSMWEGIEAANTGKSMLY